MAIWSRKLLFLFPSERHNGATAPPNTCSHCVQTRDAVTSALWPDHVEAALWPVATNVTRVATCVFDAAAYDSPDVRPANGDHTRPALTIVASVTRCVNTVQRRLMLAGPAPGRDCSLCSFNNDCRRSAPSCLSCVMSNHGSRNSRQKSSMGYSHIRCGPGLA